MHLEINIDVRMYTHLILVIDIHLSIIANTTEDKGGGEKSRRGFIKHKTSTGTIRSN